MAETAKSGAASKPSQGDDAGKTAEQAAAEQAKIDATSVISPPGTPAPVVQEAPDDLVVPAKQGEVVDPRTGETGSGDFAGFKGTLGFDAPGGIPGGAVPVVHPDRIPADVTTGVQPDAGNDALLASAQAKAPSLTREYVNAMKISDADLGAIARGEIPPPPMPGPIHTADMYITPGGYQQVPPGVSPEASDPSARRTR